MAEAPMSENGVSTPQVLINGQLYRSHTLPITRPDDGLPIIEDDDDTPLDQMLRKYEVDGADNPQVSFWPLKLLQKIFSEKRVLAELRNYDELENAESYLKYIRPPGDQPVGSTVQTYLVTFALLVLLERGADIGKFVQENVSDQNLPLVRHERTAKGLVNLCHREIPDRPLDCFRKWKTSEKETFESRQWPLLVPYFDVGAGFKVNHYKFDDRTVLPWRGVGARSHSSSQPSRQEGGYAFVSCVYIHPCSHGFHALLEKISLKGDRFALKMLRDEDFNSDEQFRNEADLLQRFNGLVHPHLVTLLATFTRQKNRYFLFPYADGTLEQYWEIIEPKPKFDLQRVRWVSKQCSGVMAAMDHIHNPNSLSNPAGNRYGRHGDIKPDNILVFNCSDDPMRILVISDLGLSSLHRDTSRSNIPNDKVPKVPGYRPPECDLEGGTISRAYDIWTLGCLYLELLTWLLGGWELLEEFEKERKSVYVITGSINNIFFDLKRDNQGKIVAHVKVEVTKWFTKLHAHEKCSQFIHDALDIIERQMLIVLSQDRKRASSGELRTKFAEIHSMCIDNNNIDYCTKAVPVNRLTRSATAVEAHLNESAKLAISKHQSEIPVYDPGRKTRKSMRPEELMNIDNIISSRL